MSRKALLISNPGESGASNYCEGVNVDMKSYTQFLMSPAGGAWEESEIIRLHKPDATTLDSNIDNISTHNYTLIVFSGHGFYSQQSMSTIIELNKHTNYDSLRLRRYATKRTIILDCCRKIEKQYLTESALNKFARAYSPLNPQRCRYYYDLMISRCPNGILVGNACSIDETAGDSAEKGGYYSHSLLTCSRGFAENSSPNNPAIFMFPDAHECAKNQVSSLSGGNQNPQIEKPRSGPYFPFAVCA